MRHSKASDEDTKDEGIMKPIKKIDQYEHVFTNNTEFFSSYNPDMIEEALLHHLKHTENVEAKVNKEKYKIKFTLETKDGE
jgi:signal recognition particle receptor subunit beta